MVAIATASGQHRERFHIRLRTATVCADYSANVTLRYLPIQKRLKISERTASSTDSPVTWPMA